MGDDPSMPDWESLNEDEKAFLEEKASEVSSMKSSIRELFVENRRKMASFYL
nr:hypothetical protein [uncultured Roseovarius sp.]